jgi:CspA family cold shock protein
VAWFNNDKGWGFLTPTDGSADVFVHYTGIAQRGGKTRRTLQDGAAVSFEVGRSAQGRPQAVNVVMVSASGETPYAE